MQWPTNFWVPSLYAYAARQRPTAAAGLFQAYCTKRGYTQHHMADLQWVWTTRRINIVGSLDDNKLLSLIDQLVTLESQDPEAPIQLLLINAHNDIKFGHACAVIDVMASITPPVYTSALGWCESAAVLILAGGEPGHRVVHPSTRLFLDKATLEDHEVTAGCESKCGEPLSDLLAKLTHQTKAKVHKDLMRDKYMSPAEAVEYGLADIVPAPKTPTKRRKAPVAGGA